MKGIILTIVLIGLPWCAFAESFLVVTCSNNGAEISVDGKFRGECPGEFKISPGRHNVVVKQEYNDGSYGFFEKEVKIGTDAKQLILANLERVYTEKYYYEKAINSKNVTSYEDYLKNFPNGKHAQEFISEMDNLLYQQCNEFYSCFTYVSKMKSRATHLDEARNKFPAENGKDLLTHLQYVSGGNIFNEVSKQRFMDFQKSPNFSYLPDNDLACYEEIRRNFDDYDVVLRNNVGNGKVVYHKSGNINHEYADKVYKNNIKKINNGNTQSASSDNNKINNQQNDPLGQLVEQGVGSLFNLLKKK